MCACVRASVRQGLFKKKNRLDARECGRETGRGTERERERERARAAPLPEARRKDRDSKGRQRQVEEKTKIRKRESVHATERAQEPGGRACVLL